MAEYDSLTNRLREWHRWRKRFQGMCAALDGKPQNLQFQLITPAYKTWRYVLALQRKVA